MNIMLKRILLLFFFIPALLFAGKPKYDIKIKFANLKDTICFLGNYYGDKQYIKDTAQIDSKGSCEFTGESDLPGGIYLIITPSKKYFEIIINDELFFSIETDTTDFTSIMKIKGSKENQLFYNYLQYINSQQKIATPIREALKQVKDNADSTKMLQDKLTAIDKEVQNYKLDFIKQHPETFLAKVFKTSYEPEIPEAPLLPNGKKDSVYVFRYYKDHFLDNVDFSDERLLRTPVFHSKIKQYITTLTVQQPDSIIKEADSLIEKSRANKEVFKYVVWYLTNWSETSNIMGFDAIFVHLVEKYYMTNQAYWITATNLEKITSRAKILKNLLIGTIIPNLTVSDTNNVFYTLYNIKSKYTVLYFWDPTCGHCQKETPKLVAYYDSIKTKGLEVFAVNTDPNVDGWKKYIREHKLDWINVMDQQNVTGFHTTYDIYSTPVIYLLDENKKILAKRVSVEQLEEFMDRQFKKEEPKNK
jgi:peroxiredoxin